MMTPKIATASPPPSQSYLTNGNLTVVSVRKSGREGEWREVEYPQRKAVNIQWDIDPEDDDGVELPNEITIPNDIEDEEAISDYISEVTGFCHKGFELEEQL